MVYHALVPEAPPGRSRAEQRANDVDHDNGRPSLADWVGGRR
jgi:hypothetical protein